VSGSDEESAAAHAAQLRRAVASVTGFELRRQDDGKYQVVFISELTGGALSFEDDMTLDKVECWVRDNVSKDQH